MKWFTLFLAVLLLFLTVSAKPTPIQSKFTRDSIPVLAPEPQHQTVQRIVAQLISRNHYEKVALDDSLSRQIFDNYLEILDYNRIYFLQSDIDRFRGYQHRIDDFLKSGDVSAAYDIFNVYSERLNQRMSYVFKRLNQGFDFTRDDYFEPDRKQAPWPESEAQLDSIWNKRLTNEALSLKLQKKDSPAMISNLEKRYQNTLKQFRKYQSEDVFQLWMNAFATVVDPHTNYFSPKTAEDFKINMSLSLEGIGAMLQNDNDYIKIVEIVPGGPADKSGQLHANDRIVGVGQGDDDEMVDIYGWRVDDVVQLIRGPKQSVVRLNILRADADAYAPPQMIRLVRDKIKLEDRAAKADTLDVEWNGKKYTIGVIDVPTFYLDQDAFRKGDPNYKSTSRDVAALIQNLKQAGMKGLIIDLRRNGGGFLEEAVNLAGLFISQGPVVQVKDASGRISVEHDQDPGVAYDGPLMVLVDEFSASASEIFAAAMQDYKRGIIVGNQTYGKGTVQNAISLDRFMPTYDKKLGQVKLTIAKFYRINGGSTQHLGVVPDISMPTRFTSDEVGESSQKHALLWDQIPPAGYPVIDPGLDNLIPSLKNSHLKRIEANQEFQRLVEDYEQYRKNRLEKRISLNEIKRKEQLKLDGDPSDDEDNQAESEASRTKSPKKDPILAETSAILADYISLMNRSK
ncbi:MAG: carboxy terminal-processing peptidase [Candidatus Delongbacteria bacterium]|nr:carboxy terminal-processing peptidase [Candidatus Delongbacteria bacterium]